MRLALTDIWLFPGGPCAGHARGGHGLGFKKRGDLLLPLKRRSERAGKRRGPGSARAGKAEKRSEPAARQAGEGIKKRGRPRGLP